MRNEPLNTLDYKGYKINIYQDTDPLNPRTENDNLGVMVCFHRRYSLGDEKISKTYTPDSFQEYLESPEGKKEIVAILPLYLYDHSGITISTKPFSCQWDSGQIGYIYLSRNKAIQEWGKKIPLKEKLESYLESEVKTYDKYLTGSFVGYEINGPEIDGASCWGYDDEKYCIEEAKSIVDYHAKQKPIEQWEKEVMAI